MESISATQQEHMFTNQAKPWTIAERLSEAAKNTFVGRQNEMSFLFNANLQFPGIVDLSSEPKISWFNNFMPFKWISLDNRYVKKY